MEKLEGKSGSIEKMPHASLLRFQVQLRPHNPGAVSNDPWRYPQATHPDLVLSKSYNPTAWSDCTLLLRTGHQLQEVLRREGMLPTWSTNLTLYPQCLSEIYLHSLFQHEKATFFWRVNTGWLSPYIHSCHSHAISHSPLNNFPKRRQRSWAAQPVIIPTAMIQVESVWPQVGCPELFSGTDSTLH